MKPLQKFFKILPIVIAKNVKIFSGNAYKNKFPDLMKKEAKIIKKLDNTSKDNSCPINNLSNFIKIFESILFIQLNNYMENKVSKHLAGFQKSHFTQHFLLKMAESWKTQLMTQRLGLS